MTKIYIASAYTKGNIMKNVRASMDAFDVLVKKGYAPYCPLLSHYQNEVHPLPYETWLKLDLEWLRICDAVVRLPGESVGADIEVADALEHKITVFYNLKAVPYV